jgi:adenine-specific DNA methylase
LFRTNFTRRNFLLKNSSIVKQFFCQLFSGSGIISQANVFISKVNIADGSITIKATSSEIMGVK